MICREEGKRHDKEGGRGPLFFTAMHLNNSFPSNGYLSNLHVQKQLSVIVIMEWSLLRLAKSISLTQ